MKSSNCFAMMSPIALTVYCLFCSIIGVSASNQPTSTTIFQALEAEEAIELQITLNMDTLQALKMKAQYQPASVAVSSKIGLLTQDIKVRVRGRSRRKYCDFPPLKLKFGKDKLRALGLSTDHNSIKLVTHCSNDAEAQKNVLEEYLAYKLYNVLTDKSFQVQLAKVTYVDEVTGQSFKRFGIILENTNEMAERLGGKEDETMGLPEVAYSKEDLNLLSVFQYMIGNEDWRPNFLRNIKHVQLPTGAIIPVGYDFDAAGLVNATYAKPDRDLRLETILQRQFMGHFANKKERQHTIDQLITKKAALLETIDTSAFMDVVSKKVANRYIRTFFDIIEDHSKLNKAIPVKGRTPERTDVWGVM